MSAAPDTLTRARRLGVLAICCMSLFIVGIDATAVNLAIPSIGRDLDASGSQLQWVMDAYTLVLASLLMLAGSMGDRIGRRRVFQVGLVLFGIGSVCCSLAADPALLIGARGLQAVGGSMLNPVAMSIITNTFREPRERAQAIGMWGGVIGVSMALGPVIGGALVAGVGWRAIFWINVPVVVAAVILTQLYVPESRAERVRRLDAVAQALVIVMLTAVTYAIIEGGTLGWGSLTVSSCFAATLIAMIALVGWELRRKEPLLDPRFFRSIPFSGAVVAAVVGFCAMAGFLFLNTLYLQDVRGMSALHAGLMTLPMAVSVAVFGPVSGRIVGDRGVRLPMCIAGIGIGLSALLLLRIDNHTSLVYLGLAYLLFGVGFGMLNAPITNSAMSGMPREQAGVAAAIASTSRQVGGSLGVAVLPAIAFGHLQGGMATGFASATHPAWFVMLGCAGILLVLAFVLTGGIAVRSGQRVAAELGAS
ncbi:MFS transporter [Flexivirga endophytica]|uniref:MFS transporter n=1 Tax=Flexivirga endophytica TaxID=1849103 RepID=A0A916WVF4_9MICO|nr:MFS transporter [Flexivirga endophytica]GGB33781.1 MFS transporter [Flexivirga endophytica]GHB41771.1 MFS transporter [Flexivirga endophytica]